MQKKTQNDSYPRLRQALKAGQTAGVYIFHGEERYLLEHSVSQLKKLLVPQGTEEFNLRVLDSRSAADQIIQAVDSMPVLSEKTLTIVRDVDVFALGEADSSALEALLEDFPDYACLVFIYDTVEYKPDGRKKLSKKLKDAVETVEFCRQGKGSLVKWLKARFAALGRDISDADAEYLIFLSGGLMTGLAGETEKLAAYGNGGAVTRSDIDKVVIPVTEAVVFALGDALAARDYSAAMEVLGRLLDSREKPDMLIALIGRQLRQLYSARLFLKNGGAEALMAQWNMKSRYPADKLMANAGRLSLKWCRAALRLCGEADREIKFASDDKRLTLELFILRMALLDD